MDPEASVTHVLTLFCPDMCSQPRQAGACLSLHSTHLLGFSSRNVCSWTRRPARWCAHRALWLQSRAEVRDGGGGVIGFVVTLL